MESSTPPRPTMAANLDAVSTTGRRSRSASLWWRVFWIFNVLFWLSVGLSVWPFIRAVQPEGTAAIRGAFNRAAVGLILTGIIHLIYTRPFIRSRPKPVRYMALFALCIPERWPTRAAG